MKEKQDYVQDIAEIRSMMERSSKFLSLSGWAGIMAGIYALAGAYFTFSVLEFNPDQLFYSTTDFPRLSGVIGVGIVVFILAIVTAVYFSWNKAQENGEKIWNTSSRHFLAGMAVPLGAGGILIFILIAKGLLGLIAPLMLLFYGFALYNASKYTITDVKYLGLIQMALGLISAWHIEYGLLIWALGFGVIHILYGIYMYIRYEQ